MSPYEFLLIPLGFVVGAYGTLVGAGGGFVLVPVLLLIFPNEPPVSITSISLGVVFFNALSGSAAYARLKRIDYTTGIIFAVASFPGAIGGAFLVGYVPRTTFDIMFGAILVTLALYTFWSAGRTELIRKPLTGWGVVTREWTGPDGEVFRYSYNLPLGIAYTMFVGFLATLLGIGGGVIHVPVMITVLQFPVHIAVATSHFVLVFGSLSGSVVHLSNGDLRGINLVRVGLLAVGVVPGAQVGARLAQRFGGPAIVRFLTVALLALGIRLIYGGLA
ncbi:MAG TPA: sulfite exporter TauE/SafE family protein [Dehalococcoidia bacterium]|nr:sulfite exporter TauE/SafE family protein [Dehalococcoidia bacterium]